MSTKELAELFEEHERYCRCNRMEEEIKQARRRQYQYELDHEMAILDKEAERFDKWEE